MISARISQSTGRRGKIVSPKRIVSTDDFADEPTWREINCLPDSAELGIKEVARSLDLLGISFKRMTVLGIEDDHPRSRPRRLLRAHF